MPTLSNISGLGYSFVGQISFAEGELTGEEINHARLVNRVSFKELLVHVNKMNKTGCTYKEAVIDYCKRKKNREQK